MATTSRDVTLTLAVETLGADGVKQLQTAFANLAKEGGNAGPEFKQLADQIARLGEQNDALNAFKQLTVATDELKASQAAAGFALDATATELIALNAAASQAGEQQRQAAQAVIEGKKAYIDLAAAIRDLKRDTDAAGKESDAYQQRLKSLGVAQDELKKKQIDLNTALRESNTEVRNAERDVAKLETKYNQQATALDRTADALRAQAGELKNASTEAAKLGVATDDIVAAETQLVGVMARGTAALQSSADATRVLAVLQESVTKTKIEQAAATERLAAREREFSADRQRQAEQEQQAFAETARAAKLAADQIQNAFQTVGVRSAEQLQAEITQVRAAMQTLESSSLNTGKALSGAFASGEAKIAALERELRELNGTMTAGDKAAKLFSNSMGQITAGNLIADGVGYLVNKVKEMGVEFVRVNLESQRLTKALTQIYGSAQTAGAQFEFLRSTTNLAGVSIRDVSDAFLRFSAAASTSGVSLATANGVFSQVATAAGILGLKGEQVTGVLEALGQMASKGTISLEELRGQLGDRLPGAMAIAAKGLGVTQQELVKMVESGTLATNVFFPAFEKGLRETFGTGTQRIEGFIQGWNRLTNAIVKTAQTASDSTAFTNLGKAFDFVADNIKTVVLGIELLVARFAALKVVDIAASFLGLGNAAKKASVDIAAKAAATQADTAATTANTAATTASTVAKTQNAAAWGALGTAVAATSGSVAAGSAALDKTTIAARAATVAKTAAAGAMGLMGRAATGLTSLLGGPASALLLFAVYAKDLGTAIGETIGSMTRWGDTLKKNEKAIEDLAAKEKAANEARRLATAEQDIANAKASAAAAQAVKQAEQVVLSAQAETKAKEQKLKATQDLVNLQGPELAGMQALTAAAVEIADAAVKELEAKEKLVVAAEAQIAAIKLTVGANGELTKTQQEQIAKLEEVAKARGSEVEGQKETVRLLEIEAANRKIASETLKDNSGNLEKFAKAAEDAAIKVKVLQDSGVASAQAIQKAQIEAAVAMRLYKDALGDSISKMELLAKTQAAALTVSLATANASKTNYENLAKQATAQGDYTLALHYTIEAKKAERTALEISLKLKELELKTDRDATKLQLDNVKGTDAVAEAKRAELRIRLELIKAKQIELGATKDQIKALDEEIRNLANGTANKERNNKASKDAAENLSAEARARNANAAAIEGENASIERLNAAKEKAAELERKRQNVDKDGFSTNKDGGRIVAGGDLNTATGIKRFLMEAGVRDEAQATAVTREFLDSQGNVQYSNNPGQIKYGGDTLSMALLKAAERITFGGGGGTTNGFNGGGERAPTGGGGLGANAGSGGGGGFTPAPRPTNSGAGTNVTINLGAGVNMSNRAEVEKLARTLMPAIEGLNRRGVSAG